MTTWGMSASLKNKAKPIKKKIENFANNYPLTFAFISTGASWVGGVAIKKFFSSFQKKK